MARFPKPPEGSWTAALSGAGYRAGVLRGLDQPGVLRGRAQGGVQAGMAECRSHRTTPTQGQLLHQGAEGRQHLDHRGAHQSRARSRRITTSAVTAATSWCGTTCRWRRPAAVCRQFTCKYHAWRYDLDGNLTFVQQEGEFFDLDKSRYGLVPVHCEVWEGFIFVNFAPEPEQSLRDFLGPMITGLEGYPFGGDDLAVLLPLRGEGQLEALHGRVPGVLSRTHPAREPVAVDVLQGGRRGGIRGAALPHRRPAPAGQHLGHQGVGDGPGDAQADGGHLPERAVRAMGQAGSRARCPPG